MLDIRELNPRGVRRRKVRAGKEQNVRPVLRLTRPYQALAFGLACWLVLLSPLIVWFFFFRN